MLSPERLHQIKMQWLRVKEEVANAALAAGREPESVQIIGVTKYVDLDSIEALIGAGCLELGESRPQQLWDRAAAIQDRAHWHLIGHLQTNKVARTLPYVTLIHSVDSGRLLQAIDTAATSQQRTMSVLLEVKISEDATKQGLAPDQLDEVLEQAAVLSRTKICGFMGMASLDGGLDQARRDFAKLRKISAAVQTRWPELSLRELSMGMSDDFPAAIAEGATLVRIGSRLWE